MFALGGATHSYDFATSAFASLRLRHRLVSSIDTPSVKHPSSEWIPIGFAYNKRMNEGEGLVLLLTDVSNREVNTTLLAIRSRTKGKNRVSEANDNWLFNKRRRSRSVKAVGCW